jgi:hypothetical protein
MGAVLGVSAGHHTRSGDRAEGAGVVLEDIVDLVVQS